MRALKAGTLAAALLLATTGTASAADATCASKAQVELNPGLSMQSGMGSYRSESPSTIDCAGDLAGGTLAGEGSWSFKGNYGGDDVMAPGGDCLHASGKGRFAGTLPTVEIGHGEVRIAGTYEWQIIGTTYWAEGVGTATRTQGSLFSPAPHSADETPVVVTAVGEVIPLRGGDCVAKPISNARIDHGTQRGDGVGGAVRDRDTRIGRARPAHRHERGRLDARVRGEGLARRSRGCRLPVRRWGSRQAGRRRRGGPPQRRVGR
jgi:hypothetical protein